MEILITLSTDSIIHFEKFGITENGILFTSPWAFGWDRWAAISRRLRFQVVYDMFEPFVDGDQICSFPELLTVNLVKL